LRQIIVTAGVIRDEQGKVLITQRLPKAHAGLLWEFPGGKLEVGEEPMNGLIRELQEELGIVVGNLTLFDVVSHVYAEADMQVVLLVYSGVVTVGEPMPGVCAA
jgi:8-oxo-dGTP diphosphatase